MPKLNLADFEAMKNKMGLVPMVMIHPQAPYRPNQIAGLTPDIAFKQYIDGDAIPHGVKLDPDDRAEVPTRILKPTAPGVSTQKMIEIPKDILQKKQGYSMKRLSLASRLSGKAAKQIGGDESAIAIIKEAMEARGMVVPADEEEPPAEPKLPKGPKVTPVQQPVVTPPPMAADRVLRATADEDDDE